MAGFLYYLEGVADTGVHKALYANPVLADLLPQPYTVATALRGPDGGQGCVVCRADTFPETSIGHFPETQEWIERAPGVRLGWSKASPPSPMDLVRPKLQPGHGVRAGDGHRWMIPLARALKWNAEGGLFDPSCNLPVASHFDATTGTWGPSGVCPELVELWAIAQEWWAVKRKAVAAAEIDDDTPGDANIPIRFQFHGSHESAVRALAVNYFLGNPEASALGLLTSDVVVEILDALVDGPVLAEWMQKKTKAWLMETSGGSSLSDGPEARTPDTSPP